jgi:hypothetical protein
MPSSIVPPGPYFHGSRTELEVGQELKPGTVNPANHDCRLVVWAFTNVDQALDRARARPLNEGSVQYVYEIELEGPMIDPNVPGGASAAESTSVMALRGHVLRLVLRIPD